MELNERKKRILKSIVDAYIRSGEPVGSKYLTGALDLSVSSATIRNEMSELEQLGLLEQPHTSAGRVPSNLGYKVYIDNLMNRYSLTLEEIDVINGVLHSKLREMNRILEQITRMLSGMTDYTAFALTSKHKTAVILRYDAVLMGDTCFLFVMITSGSDAKTRRIQSDRSLTAEILSFLTAVFNRYLTNLGAEEIDGQTVAAVKGALGEYGDFLPALLRVTLEVLREDGKREVYMEGMANLLKYPEFSDLAKTQSLLSLLEEKEALIRMVSAQPQNGLRVLIGESYLTDALNSASCVYHTFSIDQELQGVVGLIGPRRMDYSGVIARLEYVVKSLMQYEHDKLDDGKED